MQLCDFPVSFIKLGKKTLIVHIFTLSQNWIVPCFALKTKPAPTWARLDNATCVHVLPQYV